MVSRVNRGMKMKNGKQNTMKYIGGGRRR